MAIYFPNFKRVAVRPGEARWHSLSRAEQEQMLCEMDGNAAEYGRWRSETGESPHAIYLAEAG